MTAAAAAMASLARPRLSSAISAIRHNRLAGCPVGCLPACLPSLVYVRGLPLAPPSLAHLQPAVSLLPLHCRVRASDELLASAIASAQMRRTILTPANAK